MKRFCTNVPTIAALALAGWGLMAPANAAPPTVTPSPGYDARLQEQRAAQRYQGPYYGRAAAELRPAFRHHRKRLHHGAR